MSEANLSCYKFDCAGEFVYQGDEAGDTLYECRDCGATLREKGVRKLAKDDGAVGQLAEVLLNGGRS